MSRAAPFILHIVDDFGNVIPACMLSHDAFVTRYRFFDEGWDL